MQFPSDIAVVYQTHLQCAQSRLKTHLIRHSRFIRLDTQQLCGEGTTFSLLNGAFCNNVMIADIQYNINEAMLSVEKSDTVTTLLCVNTNFMLTTWQIKACSLFMVMVRVRIWNDFCVQNLRPSPHLFSCAVADYPLFFLVLNRKPFTQQNVFKYHFTVNRMHLYIEKQN